MMTEPDGLTAVLLQLSGITQKLSDLDHRQADDSREIRDRIASLATLVNGLKGTLAEHEEALAAVGNLDRQVGELAARLAGPAAGGDGDPPGYQPAVPPRLWKLDGAERDEAITRLRAWVDQVYRPGYGYLSASLGECWDQHPLCLYVLDWLSELWSVLYLQPRRTAGTLGGQAEWHTRLLTAAADQLAQETRRCGHASPRHLAPGRAGARP
jgi:hypothetical protein